MLYDGGGQSLWDAGTSGTAGAELRLQADGNMAVYNGAGQPLWGANSNLLSERIFTAGSFLLGEGQFVLSQYRLLEMQDDCNLVLYSVVNGQKVNALWNSGTLGAGSGCYMDFQADGNLVVYDEFDQSLWAAGTSGTANAELHIQDDGNVVVYNGAGQPLWSAGTQGLSAAGLVCGDLVCDASESFEVCPSDCQMDDPEPPEAVPGVAGWGWVLLGVALAGSALVVGIPAGRRGRVI